MREHLISGTIGFVTVAASKVERMLGILLVAAAIGYLVPFVPRGWIPHDEGMIGQSATRVLEGAIPHIDYEEPYTGGLSWLYAGVFRIAGIDLINVRWVLFVVAGVTAWLTYVLARRSLRPVWAALAVWVAVTWSFPNYFAGLPSWWLLACALLCLWALVRYAETGRARHLVAAGLAAGVALAIKQTGLYVVIALALVLLSDAGRLALGRTIPDWLHRAIQWGAGAAAVLFATVLLAPRLMHPEGVYLWCPAVACVVILLLRRPEVAPNASSRPIRLLLLVSAAAVLPLMVLLIPYLMRGRLWDLVYGAVVLPRTRLTFASAAMPSGWWVVAGLPLLAILLRDWPALAQPRARASLWVVAVGLPIAALWSAAAYQAVWQSARAFASLLPIAACGYVAWRIDRPERRMVLFGAAALLAWTAMNQFPFAAPIYFSYVAPLAVVAAVMASGAGTGRPSAALAPVAVMLLLFALLSTNRGYIESLGVLHVPRRFDTALRLPRAHLRVSEDEAAVYRELFLTVHERWHGGPVIAGPDCPEVYFLLQIPNPSGTLFDFFDATSRDVQREIATWSRGEVIVLNHAPHFSPAPSGRLSAHLRREFPRGRNIGQFEVRWR